MSAYRPSYLKQQQDNSPWGQVKPTVSWPAAQVWPVAPASARLSPVRLQLPASRPSYDLAGMGAYLGPYWRVPLRANYQLYQDLREAVPVINSAIVKLRQLIGCPRIVAADNVKEELEAWWDGLIVNRTQQGFENWLSTHCDNLLTFGRAHAEIVLSNNRDEIAQLLDVDPTTCSLRPDGDSEHLSVVQYQAMQRGPVRLNPDLLISSVYDVRRDDPHGTSIIFGLPLVGEILTKMLRAIGSLWTRFGSPRYHINWDPPEGWDDPDGDQANAIMSAIETGFEAGNLAAIQGKVRDTYTTGKVTITVIGAEGQELEFTAPSGALIAQIVAATGLPPLLFGIQSNRESMATVQALLLTETIEALRGVITPGLTRLIDLRQRIAGKSRKFSLEWDDPTVQDRYEDAHADFMEEQARQFEIANDFQLWRTHFYDKLYMARKYRPDLANVDDETLLEMLPDLPDEPPEVAPPQAGQGPGQQPAGSARPTPDGNPGPRERVYALAAANGNGNGKHGRK